jgi:hypothetical protein
VDRSPLPRRLGSTRGAIPPTAAASLREWVNPSRLVEASGQQHAGFDVSPDLTHQASAVSPALIRAEHETGSDQFHLT